MSNITLKELLKNIKENKISDFESVYKTFISNPKNLCEQDLQYLLKCAVILINNQYDTLLIKFGYTIILKYSNAFNDYIPLYECASELGFIPVAKQIEKLGLIKENTDSNFYYNWVSSYQESYKQDSIYLTYQQKQLKLFIKNFTTNNIIIAPTSYGKSELIISSALDSENKKICILVPTKSLLSQMKRRVFEEEIKTEKKVKVITHPEMYKNDDYFIAIFTQERLLNLLNKNPYLAFDRIIIDEAHNILDGNPRSILLSQVIMIANNRNYNLIIDYFSPFIDNPQKIKIKNLDKDIKYKKISEFVKTERYYIYENNQLKLFDQFINKCVNIESIYLDDINFIKAKKLNKNIIYSNKPKDVQDIARRLAQNELPIPDIKNSTEYKAIQDYLGKDYILLDFLQKGIVYHHSTIPENIRLYIEHIYRTNDNISTIVTTSTLLEGVNIPAERLFILDLNKGKSFMKRSSFINLCGRICRFYDIFSNKQNSLELLEPHIYIIKSKYFDGRLKSIEKYLSNTVATIKEEQKSKEEIRNPLLENSKNKNAKEHVEFVANIEPNTIQYEQGIKIADSQLIKLCFIHNVREFNIFENEEQLLKNYTQLNVNTKINDIKNLIDTIYNIFIKDINIKKDKFKRLKNIDALKFYTMFLEWQSSGKSYPEIVNSFVNYWKNTKKKQIFIDTTFGEVKRNNEYKSQKAYINIHEKTDKEKINLAILKTKLELDYVDYYLLKYIEILNDLNLLTPTLYKKIKYGTEDDRIICLLQEGLSLDLSLILTKPEYSDIVCINTDTSEISITEALIPKMKENKVNDILYI